MGKLNVNIENTICPKGDTDCPIFAEIQQLQADVDELKEQVRTDHLTQLFNVRHFNYTLEQELERTQRSQQPTTLILLDIDHFKHFNDTFGHVVGDKVLVHLAKILKSAVRKIDVACRYGGEEFAVILPSTPLMVGVQVAERIRSQIEQTLLHDGEQEHAITISLGTDSIYYNDRLSPKAFVERTDSYLYKAKDKGRNQVCHPSREQSRRSSVSDSEKDALFSMISQDNDTKAPK